MNLSSKDYSCRRVEETFCVSASQHGGLEGFFQKKPQNMPYIHFVDKKKRNQIIMISPRFFKVIGLQQSQELCRSKSKNISSSGTKALCIEPIIQ
jgi:hypothetical protein